MAYKPKSRRETFRPPGGSGIGIDIFWGSKFNHRAARAWRPLAQVVAVWAFHIRERVRDHETGPTGLPVGPGEISGAMWKSLTVSPKRYRGGNGARVYFARSSRGMRRNRKGETYEKRKRDGRLHKKVRNADKARAVSGMGKSPWIVWTADGPQFEMRTMKKAAGGHERVNILTPTADEQSACVSVLQRYFTEVAYDHSEPGPKSPLIGDRKLVSRMQRVMGHI